MIELQKTVAKALLWNRSRRCPMKMMYRVSGLDMLVRPKPPGDRPSLAARPEYKCFRRPRRGLASLSGGGASQRRKRVERELPRLSLRDPARFDRQAPHALEAHDASAAPAIRSTKKGT